MIAWIQKAKPPIVLLENVCGAQWTDMAKIMGDEGYLTNHIRLDTKKYYIPHTRTRVYMFCIRKAGSITDKAWRGAPSEWQKMLQKLQRPASASLDSCMLPEDDMRVLLGRIRLTLESLGGGGAKAGRTDWVCRQGCIFLVTIYLADF